MADIGDKELKKHMKKEIWTPTLKMEATFSCKTLILIY
jgi:hypothetical protein